MLSNAIYDLLSTDAGVSAIVGTRIYPLLIEQGADMPAIAYTLISNTRVPALNADTTITEARVQVDLYGNTFDSVVLLADAVRVAAQRYAGTNATVVILDIIIESESHSRDDTADLFRVSTDLMIIYRE